MAIVTFKAGVARITGGQSGGAWFREASGVVQVYPVGITPPGRRWKEEPHVPKVKLVDYLWGKLPGYAKAAFMAQGSKERQSGYIVFKCNVLGPPASLEFGENQLITPEPPGQVVVAADPGDEGGLVIGVGSKWPPHDLPGGPVFSFPKPLPAITPPCFPTEDFPERRYWACWRPDTVHVQAGIKFDELPALSYINVLWDKRQACASCQVHILFRVKVIGLPDWHEYGPYDYPACQQVGSWFSAGIYSVWEVVFSGLQVTDRGPTHFDLSFSGNF